MAFVVTMTLVVVTIAMAVALVMPMTVIVIIMAVTTVMPMALVMTVTILVVSAIARYSIENFMHGVPVFVTSKGRPGDKQPNRGCNTNKYQLHVSFLFLRIRRIGASIDISKRGSLASPPILAHFYHFEF